MQLPYFQTSLKELSLLQTRWKAIIDPVIAIPSNQGSLLANVPLVNGSNTINHLLGRKLVGWSICRQNALASIYDAQDVNQHPELTLVLISNATVIVTLEVF